MSEPSSDYPEASLPRDVAARLLELLSTDDGFRKLFVTDFHTALAKVGYTWDVDGNESNDKALQHCIAKSDLAPKGVIAEARDALMELLVGGTSQHSHHLQQPPDLPEKA